MCGQFWHGSQWQELVYNIRLLMEKNVRLEKEVKGLLHINKSLEDDNMRLQKSELDIRTSVVCVLLRLQANVRRNISLLLFLLTAMECWYALFLRMLIVVLPQVAL